MAKKNYNRTTAELIEMIKDSFDNMDKLIGKTKDKNFISEYTSARIVIDLGYRHDKPEEETTNEGAKEEDKKDDEEKKDDEKKEE